MRRPEIVFIDTSVFIKENYFAPENRIHTLADLARRGKVRIVMTEITCQEIRKHIKSDIRTAWKDFNSKSRTLRNNPLVDSWYRDTNENKEIDATLKQFDAFISVATVLDYSFCLDVEKVFSQYFGRQKPFGDGMKKDEFPDAFVLESLEQYAVKIHRKINILSLDKDLEDYKSKHLICVDYRQFVSEKLKEDTSLEALNSRLTKDKAYLEHYARNEASDYLDDSRIYMGYLSHLNVIGHDVVDVSAEIDALDYEIIGVKPHFIDLVLAPVVSFTVNVDYNDFDIAMYDPEDGKWYGVEEGTYVIKSSTPVAMTLRYFFVQEPGDTDALDIISIDLAPLLDAIE